MARAIDDVVSLLNRLIQAEYDAVDARRAAITHLSRADDRQRVGAIVADHSGHVDALAVVVRNLGGEPLSHGDLRRSVRRGRSPASHVGDGRGANGPYALEALRSYEEGTRAIYEDAASRPGIPIDVLAVLEHILVDERKHVTWINVRLTVPVSDKPST